MQPLQGEAPQQLTNRGGTAGVPQEYLPFTEGRRVTLTDVRLVSVVRLWMKLPDSVRDQIEALISQSGNVFPR